MDIDIYTHKSEFISSPKSRIRQSFQNIESKFPAGGYEDIHPDNLHKQIATKCFKICIFGWGPSGIPSIKSAL